MVTGASAALDPIEDPARHAIGRRHPRGLLVLAGTEMWERFSFYGMQALLVLYMAQTLLPSHPETHVWGFAGFRTVIEGVVGQIGNQALASQIFGLYAGLVYLTPILGGWLGDRWLGRRRTVVLGAALMAAGHFLLAFDASFLIALGLLVLGSGCLKGNIAAQVGRLYAPEDERRDRAYLWFNLGINLGAFAGPLVCGTLGDKVGWHWGFATAGFGMLIGILIYLGGLRHLPPDRPQHSPATAAETQRLTRAECRRVLGIIIVILLLLAYNLPFGQGYNVFPLWISEAADLHVSGSFTMPVPWYLASDGFITVASTPIVLALWRRQAARGVEPGEITKIAIGCGMMAVADLLLTGFSLLSPTPHRLFFAWGFLYFLVSSSSYLFTMPILLALVSKAAPPRLIATLMGVAYAGLFVANIGGGWIGRFYATTSHASFWGGQAAIAVSGVIMALLFRRPLLTLLSEVENEL
jgi:POT family proton-dependent oligopeptide transporter